jgi:hypothetical protein
MSQAETSRFTVGVFTDVPWAQRGLAALARSGFPPDSLTVIAKEGPETASLIQNALGKAGTKREIRDLGSVLVCGPLVEAIDGPGRDLNTIGLAAAFKRAGYQAHDGQIFETLTARGGVLVAVSGEYRAADALATLFAFGGANAAIGAWTGRV